LELADPAIWNLWTSLSQQLVPGRFNCCAWADEWKNWVDNSGPTGATQRPAARKILYLMACFVSDVMRQHLGHDQKGGSGKMAEVCSVIAARIQEPLLRRWYDITSEADLRILRRAQIGLVIEAYADELAQILAMV
jgi:hypothetical protein